MKIALILPIGQSDMLTDTVIDGLFALEKSGRLTFKIPDTTYQSSLPLEERRFGKDEFVKYAQEADLVLLCWGKRETNTRLAEMINRFDKTIYVDGSEVGGNRRYDFDIQRKLLEGTYKSHGAIDRDLLAKCALYFRREKPYVPGVRPLPFGIESRYVAYEPSVKKDIDFFCVFGQDEFPIMRRHAREMLKDFCDKNGFTCQVERTSGFTFDPKRTDGRHEFYKLLARSKVGISIGGGGFDTARFWEILGNNCMLMTERVDIYEADSKRLDYERITEFNNLHDFAELLPKVAAFLRSGYDQAKLEDEYSRIMAEHSAKARVIEVIEAAKAAGLVS